MMDRMNITVLPGDDPNKERLGFRVLEIPHGRKVREFCEEILSPELLKEWEEVIQEIEAKEERYER